MLEAKSIMKIANAISREATNTVMVLLCKSGTEGHCTLYNNSSVYVANHAFNLLITLTLHGRQESNPQPTVLETVALPIELLP